MLTIFCGNDTGTSRKKYSDYVQAHTNEYDSVVAIDASSPESITHQLLQSQNLFGSTNLYTIENMTHRVNFKKALEVCDGTVDCVMWDTKADPKILKKSYPKATIIESVFPTTIWNLLDSLKPGSKENVLHYLDGLKHTVDEYMLMYMMQQRFKDMILATYGKEGKRRMAPWQASRLKSQGQSWDRDKLVKAYEKIIDMEVSIKDGSLTYSLTKALQLFIVFYI